MGAHVILHKGREADVRRALDQDQLFAVVCAAKSFARLQIVISYLNAAHQTELNYNPEFCIGFF